LNNIYLDNKASEFQLLICFIFFMIVANVATLVFVVPDPELSLRHQELYKFLITLTLPFEFLTLFLALFTKFSRRVLVWTHFIAVYVAGCYGFFMTGGVFGPFSSFHLAFLLLTVAFFSPLISILFGISSFVAIVLCLFLTETQLFLPYVVGNEIIMTEQVIFFAILQMTTVIAVLIIISNIRESWSENEKLTSSLIKANEDLSSENELVEKKVQERTKELEIKARELLRAKNMADEAAQLKSNILANMSHEIRTPLTSIIGTADLLKETSDGENRELVDMIFKGGERLMDTLNSVLDLAQLEGRSAKLDVKATNLLDELRTVVEFFISSARSKGIGLTLEAASEGVFVANVDKAAFNRVIQNILGNAIKFTKKGKVEVSIWEEYSQVLLSISDTGIGMSEEFLPKLFDQFSQESMGESRVFEGNGLGMALTKPLVEMMKGTISVTSTLGKGSRFIVSFPSTSNSPNENLPSRGKDVTIDSV